MRVALSCVAVVVLGACTLSDSRSAGESRPALIRGSFVYMADAGLFTDCGNGRRYPVAQLGDNAALERAYGEARPAPGAPVVVTVEGRISRLPGMEGGMQDMLVVKRLDRTWPGETCDGPVPRTVR
jgi:copper homeostasis protein (lipoprotein)